MSFKPNLLCIVPPYTSTCPPAGAAALLGYMNANGCDDFAFLDLRLHAHPTSPYSYAPTYRPSGVFGESFVIDVPDLPLVLHVLKQHDNRNPLSDGFLDEWFVNYCIGRGIHPHMLAAYLNRIDLFLESAFAQLPDLRFVGFSTWTSNFLTTLMAAAHLKRRRDPPFIVVGGPQVTESPNSAKLGLRSMLFDAVALGEGEETLLSLYEEFCKNGKRVDVPVAGTMQMDSGTGAFVSSRRQLLRLKSLPLPDFSQMMIGSYRSESGGRELPYQLSRGCTDKCTFCSEWVFWQKMRIGSMESAVEHIEELVRRHDAEVIHFTDSLLNGVKSRLCEFAETMLTRATVVPWFGFMRADMDAETADLIQRAGCVQAFIGIESFSDETLVRMNKRRTEADNIRALHMFLKSGIRVVAGIIPGFPGDTRERFMHTARVLVDVQEKYPGLLQTNTEPFILSPGQPMYRELDKFGMSIQTWPEEITDGAGKYAEIARQVAHTFTGPNQGVERLGEFHIAKTLLGDGNHTKSLEEARSPFELNFRHLYKDIFLARTQSGVGHAYSLLVTQAEKETYERMRSAERLLADQKPYEPAANRGHYLPLWKKLEQQHTLCGSRESFVLFAVTSSERVDDESLLRASPFIIARIFGSELLVVHSTTLAFIRLPTAAGPWFASVARKAQTMRELSAEAARMRLPIQITDFVRKGFVEICSSDFVSKPFGGRVPAPA